MPLDYEFQEESQRIAIVDVAKLYGLSVAIPPQKLRVPRPGLATRNLSARARCIVPHYQEGLVRIDIDMGFQ